MLRLRPQLRRFLAGLGAALAFGSVSAASAALGTPTVTLMSGNSLPVEWAPLGDSLVLRAEVPCSPCHRSVCPYELECLRALTPTRVARPAIDFLRARMPATEREAAPAEPHPA